MRTSYSLGAFVVFGLASVLAGCGGSGSFAPTAASGGAPLAQAYAREPFAANPATTTTQYLYIVNTTADKIEKYPLPLVTPLVAATAIPIVQPAGYTVSGMAVDTDGSVLYVSNFENANFPPPNQPLYRCKPACRSIGTIPGGSGIAIVGSTLYATAAAAQQGGYDYSQVLSYAYTTGGKLGAPTVVYQDSGMDGGPVYGSVAVAKGYLVAAGTNMFDDPLVCTGVGSGPICGKQTVKAPGIRLNGAVALSATHKLFLGLSFSGGTNSFGELCTETVGVYSSCNALNTSTYGDEVSTAAIDSTGTYYNTADANLNVFQIATKVSLQYLLGYSYGPIAIGK